VQALYEATNLRNSAPCERIPQAIEKAGLRLVVNASPLGSPLTSTARCGKDCSLLLNAFKFTFRHHRVPEKKTALPACGHRHRHGIPADELPRLLSKRVEGAQGRTYSSGIGLALVQELTRLLGKR
jgi:hypothetical protein